MKAFKRIVFLFNVACWILNFFPDAINLIGVFSFLLFALPDNKNQKLISPLLFWNAGFIYIISLELVFELAFVREVGLSVVNEAIGILYVSNYIINGYYLFAGAIPKFKPLKVYEVNEDRIKNIIITLSFLTLPLFILIMYNGLFKGRANEESSAIAGGIVSQVLCCLGLFNICLIQYYQHSSLNKPLWTKVIVSIYVACTFFSGTRFIFLLAISPLLYWYVKENTITLKRLFLLSSGIILVYLGTIAIRSIRNTGLTDSDGIELKANSDVYFESEGTVKTFAKIVDYYQTRPYDYGSNTFAILVFWVPRAIWPDKPKQIDYTFIREYESSETFSDNHSTGSGYLSNIYADFGIAGVIFESLIIGYVITNMKKMGNIDRSNPQNIFLSSGPGFIFFFVRNSSTVIFFLTGYLVLYSFFVKSNIKLAS